jgi:TPR repeat protein
MASQVALRLVARAALAGHAPAMCNVGVSFETGVGAPVDPSAAVKWYQVRPHTQTHARSLARSV